MAHPPIDVSILTFGLWAPQGLRPVIQSIIRHAGGRDVVEFATGSEFDAGVEGRPVDLVLVDEDADAPDAFSLAARRAQPGGAVLPPVVLMAASPTRELLAMALSAGIGSVIAKPFSARTLVLHVRHALSPNRAPAGELTEPIFLD